MVIFDFDWKIFNILTMIKCFYIQKQNKKMNWISLEQLERQIQWNKSKNSLKTIFWEIGRFLVVFSIVFVVWVVFINLDVFVAAFQEKFLWNSSYASDKYTKNQWINLKNLKNTVWINNNQTSDNFENYKMKDFLTKLDSVASKSIVKQEKEIFQKDLTKHLKTQITKYDYNFNFLPPKSRIIIPDISVDAPVVQVLYATPEKLEKADFDAELYKWVVKYPYWPEPGNDGNILIFGHTSYYWWKKNPYWDIFAKLPKLVPWNRIQLIREWKKVEYEIIESVIKTPKKVWELFDQYTSWKHLFLMGCYPIWTDTNRILVVAKQIESKDWNLAVNK